MHRTVSFALALSLALAPVALAGEGDDASKAAWELLENEQYAAAQAAYKELAKADEDDYMNSAWADPKGMKKSLQGLDGGVKAPGLRFG